MLGLEVPVAEIDQLFDEWDPDKSGKLELKELNSKLRRGAEVTLAAELQDGAQGEIETEATNKHALVRGASKGEVLIEEGKKEGLVRCGSAPPRSRPPGMMMAGATTKASAIQIRGAPPVDEAAAAAALSPVSAKSNGSAEADVLHDADAYDLAFERLLLPDAFPEAEAPAPAGEVGGLSKSDPTHGRAGRTLFSSRGRLG